MAAMDSVTIEDWCPVVSGDTQQDLTSLRGIDGEINALEFRILRLRADRLLLETALAPYFSSIIPINRCPPEILLKIFEVLASDHITSLTNILPVCRNWHDIAMDSPSLWARISFKLEPGTQLDALNMIKCIETCIPRSRASPLHLDLDFSSLQRNWYNVLTHTNHILRLISKLKGEQGALIGRWKQLRLTLPELTGDTDAADDIWKDLEFSAPNLVEVEIHNTDSALWSLRDRENGFALREKPSSILTNIQNLRRLTLDTPETSMMFLNTGSLASIEYLDVPTPSVGAIAACVSHCRVLNTLTLRRAAGFSFEPHPQGPFILDLPMLRHLRLLNGVTALDRVEYRVPPLKRFHIGTVSNPSIDLPNLESKVIVWSPGYTKRPDEATKLLESLLRTYRSVERMEIPQRFGGTLVPLIKRTEIQGDLPPSLNDIILWTGLERTEMIIVRKGQSID